MKNEMMPEMYKKEIDKLNERFDSSIELSIIDLKAQGKETVSLFEILRNSLDFK
jgi:hypothetical protein